MKGKDLIDSPRSSVYYMKLQFDYFISVFSYTDAKFDESSGESQKVLYKHCIFLHEISYDIASPRIAILNNRSMLLFSEYC